jgi:hypothetical protein
MVAALRDIVISESFEAVEDENLEDRYTRPGQLTVISMHKAKGLDWDVVFMPFLHKRIIPGELFQKEAVKFLGEFTLPEVGSRPDPGFDSWRTDPRSRSPPGVDVRASNKRKSFGCCMWA